MDDLREAIPSIVRSPPVSRGIPGISLMNVRSPTH